MSSTNKTINHELSQFLGSDKPSFLTDYNSDMSKIDLALKTIADVSSGADTKGTDALAGLGTLEDRVEAVEEEVDDLNPYKAKVDDLETALPLKAPLESPAFTGNPTVPDQTVGNNSTRSANTKFVIDQANSMAVRKDTTSSPIVVNGVWCGTQGQYDSIGTKDNNVLYLVI